MPLLRPPGGRARRRHRRIAEPLFIVKAIPMPHWVVPSVRDALMNSKRASRATRQQLKGVPLQVAIVGGI